jgi:hypothetical protein
VAIPNLNDEEDRMSKYTQSHWDEYERLRRTGLNKTAALRMLGIPKNSMGAFERRFSNGVAPAPTQSNETASPSQDQPIGGLAADLNAYTETLLGLASEMSELTRHAQGLVALDRTLTALDARRHEAHGLRQRLAQAEAQLIARASVVHSND